MTQLPCPTSRLQPGQQLVHLFMLVTVLHKGLASTHFPWLELKQKLGQHSRQPADPEALTLQLTSPASGVLKVLLTMQLPFVRLQPSQQDVHWFCWVQFLQRGLTVRQLPRVTLQQNDWQHYWHISEILDLTLQLGSVFWALAILVGLLEIVFACTACP